VLRDIGKKSLNNKFLSVAVLKTNRATPSGDNSSPM